MLNNKQTIIITFLFLSKSSFLPLRFWAFSPESLFLNRKKNFIETNLSDKQHFNPEVWHHKYAERHLLVHNIFSLGLHHFIFFFFYIPHNDISFMYLGFPFLSKFSKCYFWLGFAWMFRGERDSHVVGRKGYGEVKASEGKAWDCLKGGGDWG